MSSVIKNPKALAAGFVGNILDHYDLALYGFLAPFIAPIFFKNNDPIVQLILAYGLMSTSIITRPLGALVFGKIAINYGAKQVLFISLIGVAITTLLMGLVPGYDSIGVYAPIFLVVIRTLQSFFAAGEHGVAPLFILEQVENAKHAQASSYYNVSSMIGATIASCAATLVSFSSNPSYSWRYAFIAGSILAIAGLYLRFHIPNDPKVPNREQPNIRILFQHKATILRIVVLSSFSFMTYSIPFIFFNTFIPTITEITKSEMLTYNNILLTINVLLTPFAGHLGSYFRYNHWMAIMTGLLGLTIIPLFLLLDSGSFWVVTSVRLWIIVLGLACSAVFKAWLYTLVQGSERYLVVGFGYSLGSELLGRSTTALCWYIWYSTNHAIGVLGPALYIAILSFAATIALLYRAQN